jgi:hypothetical protein
MIRFVRRNGVQRQLIISALTTHLTRNVRLQQPREVDHISIRVEAGDSNLQHANSRRRCGIGIDPLAGGPINGIAFVWKRCRGCGLLQTASGEQQWQQPEELRKCAAAETLCRMRKSIDAERRRHHQRRRERRVIPEVAAYAQGNIGARV